MLERPRASLPFRLPTIEAVELTVLLAFGALMTLVGLAAASRALAGAP
jgi:hypothetical protein